MSIRVEWLDDKQTILCCTPQQGWNWQESHRVLEEWVRPLLANAKQNIGLVADLRQAGIFGGDVDLLLRRLQHLVRDSMQAKALAVVGLPKHPESADYILVDTLIDASARLSFILKK
jgi:hypothetical protein